MNKHLYRIVFNNRRAQLMAVAETVSGDGKSGGKQRRRTSPKTPVRPPRGFSLWVALVIAVCLPPPANAQIVAYRSAQGNLQPTILSAGNGIPLVNIQTPSGAGVSRNSYSQFDVQSSGAILNNSRRDTQTQLGGWVPANPWLATGSARVILNQVLSANPSRLLGYLEVAGSNAQVVIANPAGVACAGCGFINANRVTLSTGTPIINGGTLDGYRVEGGILRVEGAGLDASRVTHTDLIARAVEINAGLWANTLNITTGANQVDADHHLAAPIAGTGSAPAFALDVAQLGGMYAGKIKLIGTEAGVGVRNAGAIGASVGEVIISADGRLHNSGHITSTAQTQIDTGGGIDNNGTIYARGDAILTTRGNIDNSGIIAALGHTSLSATGTGSQVSSSASSLLAAGLNPDSSLVGSSRLEIRASEQISWHGQAVASGDQAMHASTLDLSDSQLRADNLTLTAASGDLDARRSVLNAAGTLSASATQSLLHDSAHSDAKQLQLAAHDISNANGQLIQTGNGQTVINASGFFDNRGGTLATNGSLDLRSGALTNDGGLIQAGGELAIDTHGQRLSNANSGSAAGILGQNAIILVTGDLDNSAGFIGAKGTLTATSSGVIDNSGGLISSTGSLQILDPDASSTSNVASKTLAITNTGGTLVADQQLAVDSASLSGDGAVLSQRDLTVKLLADFAHTGQFSANGNALLETAGNLINRAALRAGKRLDIKATSVANEASGEIVATTLQLTATDHLTNRGLIDGDDTFIDSATLNNRGTGRIYGDHLAIAATVLSNAAETIDGVSKAPVIAARERLDIGAATISNREHAQLFSAGDLSIGGALDANHYASGQAATLDNASATIEALGNLAINAGQINNTNEHFSTEVVAAGSQLVDQYVLSGSATRYDPNDVTLQWDHAPGTYFHPPQGNGMGYMSQQGFFSDNSNNYIYLNTPAGSGRNFWLYSVTRSTMETQVLTTDPGKIIAAGNLDLNAGSVFNHNSQIVAGGSLAGTIGQLNNVASAGERTVSDNGTAWFIFRDKDHHDSDRDSYAYNPAPIVTGFLLPSLRYDSNASAPSSNTSVAPLVISSVNQVATLRDSASGPQTIVRTVTPNTALPISSLFRTNPTAHYLIEADPKFASYRQWLSSDYLLNALALDPAITQQRLGDAFYEQRLIREQIAQLTGRRFLDGYASDEAQYQALMDAGLGYARRWQLIPGVALSAEQIAQLTSDIVWLVEQEIALPNGQTTRALVPQVYVRVRDGDLAPSGALIAANDIDLRLSGDLINSGAIAGRQIVALSAENIGNLGGHIGGQDTFLAARNDLINLGGSLQAQDRLIARAGRDLIVESSTRTQTNGQGSRTNIDRVAGLYVTGSNGTLVAAAGNDLTLLAAAISNAAPTAAGTPDTENGTTLLFAGNNLTLGTVGESNSQASARDGRNYRRTTQNSEVGTDIRSTSDLTLQAGNDLTARAASVTSDHGALSVLAGNDLAIAAGKARSTVDEAHRYTQKGFLSSTTTTTRDTLDSTTALASTLSGDTVALQSGRDTLIKGSNVVASGDATLLAGNNLTIEAATETRSESHFKKTTQSGIFGSGGIGFTIGSRQLSTDQQTQATTAAASTIGSTDGDVLMNAGNTYRQVGSDVIAAQGSIGISAKSVDILEARETSRTTYETKAKQSGLTIAITSPVISAVQTAQQMADAASDTKDSRMKALATASTALAVKSTYDDVKTGQGTTIDGKPNQMPVTDDSGKVIGSRDATASERAGGINLSISIGGSSSSSKTTQTSDSAAMSTLAAEQNITIVASGAAKNSDLTIQGANLTAGNNIVLSADDEISLLAAKNSAEQHSNNKNGSASVGFSIGTKGLLFNVGASIGRGHADGADTNWTNTDLSAGRTVSLESGGDTTMRGALVGGEQVIAKVGSAGQGNLLIESLQDISRYDSKQQSAGVSVSIGMGRISGSISYSQSKVSSDYASVTEQSGIKAGDGGFQVEVKGDTALNGALIASTQSAVDNQRNTISIGGSLTTHDIENRADYSAKSMSVNLGSSMSFDGKLTPGGTGAGYGKDSGSAGSTTQAGISGIAGNSAVRTGDGETRIARIFDADKVQKEISAQVQITQLFGQQASQAVDNYAESQMSVLRARYAAETDREKKKALQAEVDSLRLETQVMNVLIGAVTGNGAAALTKESLSAGAEEMRKVTLENSKLFDGIIDESAGGDKPFVLSNTSGVSAGGKWDLDPFKGGGTRVNLDNICGADNSRCKTTPDANGNKVLDLKDGKVQWDKSGADGQTLAEYLASKEGQDAAGAAGGIQGWKGTLAGIPYVAGSWQDKLVVAFEGTHDLVGGQLPGGYDALGNTKRGMSETERFVRDRVSEVALIPSAPFAAATLLSPEVWNAISIFLKAAK